MWEQFISPTQQSHGEAFVCSRHFTEDSFLNKAQYEAGFSKRLLLNPGSIPTRTGQECGRPACVRTKEFGCQTDFRFQTVSTATQLSLGTLGPHVRSKSTQIGPDDFRTQSYVRSRTSSQSATSEYGMNLRSAKRKRSEMEEDFSDTESGQEPGASVTGTSVKEPTQMSDEDGMCDHTETKCIVFESCLRELFETCLLCKHKCEVQHQRQGTFISFTQTCPVCNFQRRWQNQPVREGPPGGDF
ncbi:hypothetical protein OJAV_G00001150 [Oryzias javanicus]|uniref:THAP-type domain-containing protein n=1 Tax=Oryzias javanicus TaxID=123683 RepID=A0A437DLF8_ORYJA|nr:hypothetical protein OJAV_G00001150 [Oryzias javanicus]